MHRRLRSTVCTSFPSDNFDFAQMNMDFIINLCWYWLWRIIYESVIILFNTLFSLFRSIFVLFNNSWSMMECPPLAAECKRVSPSWNRNGLNVFSISWFTVDLIILLKPMFIHCEKLALSLILNFKVFWKRCSHHTKHL